MPCRQHCNRYNIATVRFPLECFFTGGKKPENGRIDLVQESSALQAVIMARKTSPGRVFESVLESQNIRSGIHELNP